MIRHTAKHWFRRQWHRSPTVYFIKRLPMRIETTKRYSRIRGYSLLKAWKYSGYVV